MQGLKSQLGSSDYLSDSSLITGRSDGGLGFINSVEFGTGQIAVGRLPLSV